MKIFKAKSVGFSRPPVTMDRYRPRKVRRILFYQVVISLLILLVAAALLESNHPWTKETKRAARALLTWDIKIGPRVVKLADNFQDSLLSWVGRWEKDSDKVPAFTPEEKEQNLVIPVSGKILKQFGWQNDELDGLSRYNEGINIKAKVGTPIKSALAGKVTKVAKDPVYGDYIIIKHSGSLQTLYAHCLDIDVKEGEQVKTGEVIAKVGSSGAVEEGQVHFEVRQKGTLIDPLTKFRLHKRGV